MDQLGYLAAMLMGVSGVLMGCTAIWRTRDLEQRIRELEEAASD